MSLYGLEQLVLKVATQNAIMSTRREEKGLHILGIRNKVLCTPTLRSKQSFRGLTGFRKDYSASNQEKLSDCTRVISVAVNLHLHRFEPARTQALLNIEIVLPVSPARIPT